MTDLWGNPDPEPMVKAKTKRYQAKGYAQRPGTGPEGETCKTCEHAIRTGNGRKNFYKCAIIRHRWTNGPGTDIKLKSPACSMWATKQTNEPK